jgi:hypothetical protein
MSGITQEELEGWRQHLDEWGEIPADDIARLIDAVEHADGFCEACRWYGCFMAAVAGAAPLDELQRLIDITRKATGKPPPHSVEAMSQVKDERCN